MLNTGNLIQTLKDSFSYRSLKKIERSKNEISYEGKKLINFSSNDYLGFSQHPTVIEQSIEYLKKYGAGVSASRLVTGNLAPYEELENALCSFKKTASSLVFSSGYLANLGIITSLLNTPNSIALIDRLAHASIIDGVLLSKKKWVRFHHNDMEHLTELLEKNKHIENKLIITESVFSMDGDLAPIPELIDISKKHSSYLYIDEAHSTGVFGDHGSGVATQYNPTSNPHLILMGTFSKALGNYGAYFAGDAGIREWLINTSRSFIYTTGLPPAVLGGVLASLSLLNQNPMLGSQVLNKAKVFRELLIENKIPLIPGNSQIISILTQTKEKTLTTSKKLIDAGYLGIAIRPPTVEENKCRIRLAINIHHKEEDFETITALLKKIL